MGSQMSESKSVANDGRVIDGRTKGVPGGTAPFDISDIGARRWNVLGEDLPLPLAVLKWPAITHNSQWMRRFLAASGAALCPHGKTTMSPELFRLALEDGAWGITISTSAQLEVCRHHGIQRVVFANQLVGKQAIRYVLDEIHGDPDFDFYCWVDSGDGVRMLADAAAAHPCERPIQVLVEGGIEGRRTGCRSPESALAVARIVRQAAPAVALRGIAGFEGLITGTADSEARVRRFLGMLAEIAGACESEELFAAGPVLLSAGGSLYYDLVVEVFSGAGLSREVQILTRSGCYLSHDSGMYRSGFADLAKRSDLARELGDGLKPALEVWAYVQSIPESGRAIVTMGRRDVSFDAGYPLPASWFRPGEHKRPQRLAKGYEITALNDQHGYLTIPEGCPFQVGDMVAFGISHPCTTFDKWRVLYVIDNDYEVISALNTYF